MAETAYEQIISLPMFSEMTDADVEKVIAIETPVLSLRAKRSNLITH